MTDTEKEIIEMQDATFDNYIVLLKEFCKKYDIENMKEESQQTFNAYLLYVYDNLYKRSDLLKDNNISYCYNIDYINNIVLPIYIKLCNIYNKIIDIYSLSYLTNIDITTFNKWLKDNNDIKKQMLAKRVYFEKEHTLQDKLISTKTAGVNILAVLNHYYGWSNNTDDKPDTDQQTTQAIKSRYQYQIPTSED